MNIENNKKRKNSQFKIKKVFMELIQVKDLNKITVSDICKTANINRSTFYGNYIDIYDLADKIKDELFQDVLDLYPNETKEKKHSYNFLNLLKHIKDNQIFYKTYFKLDYDNNSELSEKMIDYGEFEKFHANKQHIEYHITFFKCGFNAVIKRWLHYGCLESPEEIRDIIVEEYKNKIIE